MNIIREKRLALGMTQKQLAGIIGCSGRAISDWGRNSKRPKEIYLAKLADALECNPAELPQMYRHASDTETERERLSREKAMPYKERRLALGLTQKELAQKAGVSRRSIIDMECGSHIPFWETLQKIRRALGMPEERYFTIEERNRIFAELQQQGIINWVIRKNKRILWDCRSDMDDLYQTLVLCAIRAIDRYDPGKGASVKTFTVCQLKGAVKRWAASHRKHGITGKLPFPFQVVSLDAMMEAGFDIPG